DARVVGARASELRLRALDLPACQMPDDGHVAHVPGERVATHSLRRIQPDERRARNAEHRLEILADVCTVPCEHLCVIAEAERRTRPGDVVVAGHDDRVAHLLGLANELARPLKLAGARAL